MRKLLFPLLLLPALGSRAQVTLSTAVHLPGPGYVEKFRIFDTLGFNPGGSGPNQVWNFTNIYVYPGTFANNYLQPSATPYASSFQSSDFALQLQQSPATYDYHQNTGNQFQRLGNAATGDSIVFDDPEIHFFLPMQYNDSLVDPYAWAVYHNPNNYDSVSGVSHVKADAYGTIMLPWGTYSALRVKTTTTRYDVTHTGPYWTTTHNFRWFIAGYKYPVMLYEYYVHPPWVVPQITTGRAWVAVSDFLQNVEEVNGISGFSLHPNPAAESSTISFTLEESAEVSIRITDLSGRVIRTIEKGKIAAGFFEERIDLEGLAAGLYAVSIHAGEKMSVRKLSVQ